MSVTPHDNLCFAQHSDWTGPHTRIPSCPEAKWFINEEGNVYDYPPDMQAEMFPNDDHTPYDTQDEAEKAAAAFEDIDFGVDVPVEQMPYDDAISYAIFAINTLMHPDASDADDVDTLEAMSDQVIATLADIRETVRGLQPEVPPIEAEIRRRLAEDS